MPGHYQNKMNYFMAHDQLQKRRSINKQIQNDRDKLISKQFLLIGLMTSLLKETSNRAFEGQWVISKIVGS